MESITAQAYYAFHKLFSLVKLVNPHKTNAIIIPIGNWGK